jgi:hypothetical protein
MGACAVDLLTRAQAGDGDAFAQISAMTRFDPGILPRFGLPATLGN